MDKATIRILDTISSSTGETLSINQLTERIKNTYGSAYYANIYQKLQELKNDGLLNIEPLGRSSIVTLNFANLLLIDNLAEMELEKKIEILSERNNIRPFFDDLNKFITDRSSINSVTAINPLKNIKLNRIELLFLLRNTPDYLAETGEILKELLNFQKRYNIQVNSLILEKNDFFSFLTSEEINPVREALNQRITLYNPQAFWSQIKELAGKSQIRAISSETKPLKISESDLAFNLNRFGYSEFGASFVQGKKFCIEYITTSLLLREEARGIDAVAVILAKNNFNSNLLTFLGQKYKVLPRLLGILQILKQINAKPEVNETIKILKAMDLKSLSADETSIKQKLELYNAL